MAANLASLPLPPNYVPFQHRVLAGGLKVGAVTSNGGTNIEVFPIAFTRFITIRAKTATNGGTLQADFVRPVATEPVFNTDGSINGAQCVKYTSPTSPASVALVAGTENSLQITCNGEEYLMLTFTGSVGAGTVTYVDVCGL